MRDNLQAAAREIWETHGQGAPQFCDDNIGRAEQRGEPDVAELWRQILQDIRTYIRHAL